MEDRRREEERREREVLVKIKPRKSQVAAEKARGRYGPRSMSTEYHCRPLPFMIVIMIMIITVVRHVWMTLYRLYT